MLDPEGDVLEYVQSTRHARQHLAWACDHTTLSTFEHQGHEYGMIDRAVGASLALLIGEELFASDCQLLINITRQVRYHRLASHPICVD